VLAAARRNPKALQLAPPALRADPGLRRFASAAPGPLVYEGERLRLVGYCNKWGVTDADLRFTRADPSDGRKHVPKGTCSHELSALLPDGRVSFQLVSCTRLFSFRVFPVNAGADGFFRIPFENPGIAAAGTGGEGSGHGSNFFIEEEAGRAVTIHAELVDGTPNAAVWYSFAQNPNSGKLVRLSQGRDQQRPTFAAPSHLQAQSCDDRDVVPSKVHVIADVEGNQESFRDLIYQARHLSETVFDERFYIRDLTGGDHLTLLVDSTCKNMVGFCYYYMPPEGFLWIEHLAVPERFQGRGLGRKLMEWARTRADRSKCSSVRLNAFLSAIPFYKAVGFQMFYRSSSVDAYLNTSLQATCHSVYGQKGLPMELRLTEVPEETLAQRTAEDFWPKDRLSRSLHYRD